MTQFNNTLLLHQENLSQRYKWQNFCYLLAGIVTLLIILVIFLSVKLANKKEIVRYVEFSSKGDFGFKVLADSEMALPVKKVLIEQQLEQYVIDRVENVAIKKTKIDEVDSSKIQFVGALSSKNVAFQYQDEVVRLYNEGEFTKRKVEMLSHGEIEPRKYRYDFKTIDTYPTGEQIEQRWVVYLKYELLDPNELKINQHKEINPLGIKITFYRGDVDKKQKVEVKDAFPN